jgi:hypothetical protein
MVFNKPLSSDGRLIIRLSHTTSQYECNKSFRKSFQEWLSQEFQNRITSKISLSKRKTIWTPIQIDSFPNDIIQCWWFLDRFWSPIVRVIPLKTPFGLLIPLLQSQSHVTTITHNYFLHCYAFTQLQSSTFVTKITYSTLARLHSLQTLHSNLYCTIAHKVS